MNQSIMILENVSVFTQGKKREREIKEKMHLERLGQQSFVCVFSFI